MATQIVQRSSFVLQSYELTEERVYRCMIDYVPRELSSYQNINKMNSQIKLPTRPFRI